LALTGISKVVVEAVHCKHTAAVRYIQAGSCSFCLSVCLPGAIRRAEPYTLPQSRIRCLSLYAASSHKTVTSIISVGFPGHLKKKSSHAPDVHAQAWAAQSASSPSPSPAAPLMSASQPCLTGRLAPATHACVITAPLPLSAAAARACGSAPQRRQPPPPSRRLPVCGG
jgi:hypothetical protein